jgi:hypothetical protein
MIFHKQIYRNGAVIKTACGIDTTIEKFYAKKREATFDDTLVTCKQCLLIIKVTNNMRLL